MSSEFYQRAVVVIYIIASVVVAFEYSVYQIINLMDLQKIVS